MAKRKNKNKDVEVITKPEIVERLRKQMVKDGRIRNFATGSRASKEGTLKTWEQERDDGDET